MRDRSLEREGERENAAGRARQASNNVMDETDACAAAELEKDFGSYGGSDVR